MQILVRLVIFILLFSVQLSAQLLTDIVNPLINTPYKSGPEFCQNLENEYPLWVTIPHHYGTLKSEKSLIYAWTKKPFNRALKTMIFVSGGPGSHEHDSSFDLTHWNVVFFDQRGIACSKPQNKNTYLDRSFYRSDYTAHDINQIRKHLKLDQVSIYGVSYGTIPAHLFGHFYPDQTRAVILEGTVYRSDDAFYQNSTRQFYVQKYFDELPESIQNKVVEYSAHPKLQKNWFSRLTSMLLYSDDSQKMLNDFLKNVFENSDLETKLNLLKNFSAYPPISESDFSGAVMQGMIGCQEMSMNATGISFYSNLENSKLIPDQKNHFQELYCQPLGFTNTDRNKSYFAEKFKTSVFTSYIQGETDSATPADLSDLHFKKATLSSAQFLLSEKGGHISMYSGMASGYETNESIYNKTIILDKLLNGKRLKRHDLSLLKNATHRNWIYKSK